MLNPLMFVDRAIDSGIVSRCQVLTHPHYTLKLILSILYIAARIPYRQ